jgi:hypothetical protein
MCPSARASSIRAADPATRPALDLHSSPPARRSPLPLANRKFSRFEPDLTPTVQITAHHGNREKARAAHGAIYPFLPLARHGRIAAL